MRVYWIYYTMGRIIAFNGESVSEAINSLHNPSTVSPSQQFITAAVLSRQIKSALYLLLEESVGDLLEGLEKVLRSNTRTNWAIAFCANLVLALLVEQLQIATDAKVMHEISKEGQDSARTRKVGTEACQLLEEMPIKYSWTLFKGKQGKYNPIKNGCLMDNNSGQNGGEEDLIREMRQLRSNYGI
jgi:hypothetical protein